MTERLAAKPSEWIDRTSPITFEFEGQSYKGYRGDVLTTALWANGVRLMGRSFKYHRPRSLYSLAGHDANVIVETDSETNLRGDFLPIEPGMKVRAVNTAGGLNRDRYRITELFSRFLPVGFYYKAFHTPRRLFSFYENRMRKMAGLGRISAEMRTPPSPKDYDFCELLVVGSGPSGLSAAIAAAEAGVDVLIVDEHRHPGGSLCWQSLEALRTHHELLQQAQSLPNIRFRLDTRGGGWYADQWVALIGRRHITKLRTGATLFATGCIEQPAVFQNNDAPGVLLGSAVQRLINLYAVKPFERAVVMTANADGYRVALDLARAKTEVAALVDLRHNGEASSLATQVTDAGVTILSGHAVCTATPATNSHGLKTVTICPLLDDGTPRLSNPLRIECDGLAVSVGWAPNSNLVAQTGAKFQYAADSEQLIVRQLPPGVFTAGRVNGLSTLDERLADGRRAGLEAAAYLGKSTVAPEPALRASVASSHPYPIFSDGGKKNFVDFDEDLHLADFVNAHQEGYDNIELMKRYSTVGMGPSQGKLSNMNAVRILARLNGHTIEQTGTTTGRPFYQPVSIGLLAGRRFHPHRETPLDGWHRANRGVMVHVGAWFRPEYYAKDGTSREDCVFQEATHVRNKVGLIDISTLTKLQVSGPDAVSFLERIYTGAFTKQKPGSTRYAMACDESGIVAEEGLVARLADDRFYITASTAGGEPFYREMQRLAIVWGMNVTLANATGHWGAINVAGPLSRELLGALTDVPLDNASFPASGVREGVVAGAPAVIIRSGFLGELSFEVHSPASCLQLIWDVLMKRGTLLDVRPLGTEAQRLLRLEKGHLITGHDTDALTTPYEANLAAVMKMDKPFFVGQRSLQILERQPQTRRLVGITFAPQTRIIPQECQLILEGDEIVGRVTSIAARSTIGRPIGLAFVQPKFEAPGTKLRIRVSRNEYANAEVVVLPFYDPENIRQK